MLYYPIVVAVLTLLSQGNLTHVTVCSCYVCAVSVLNVLRSAVLIKNSSSSIISPSRLVAFLNRFIM
jgi:hypothetical protein